MSVIVFGARWMNYRLVTRVLCDMKVPSKRKNKFCRVKVGLTILYGAECWSIKNSHMQKMKATEMML